MSKFHAEDIFHLSMGRAFALAVAAGVGFGVALHHSGIPISEDFEPPATSVSQPAQTAAPAAPAPAKQ